MTAEQFTARFLVALCLWREARGCSIGAKRAVLHTILNRAADARNRWPKTPTAVVLQPWQFSCFNKNDVNYTKYPLGLRDPEWKAWQECLDVYDAPGADPTGGANFYHDKSIPPPAAAWLGKGKTVDDLLAFRVCTMGPLSFYKIP